MTSLPARGRALVRKAGVGLDLLRMHGLPKFAFRILPWLLRRRYFLYELNLASLGVVDEVTARVRLTEAGPADIPLLLGIRPGYYDVDLLGERFRRGHLCFIGWLGDRAVHLRWAFVGSCQVPYLRRALVLAPGEILSDEVFTVPGFRGEGIYQVCADLSRALLRRRGFRRYLAFFASWDGFLIQAAGRKGMMPIGEARWTLGPACRRLRLRGALREMGEGRISVDADQRPGPDSTGRSARTDHSL
jgi:hypothetical protein